MCYTRGKHVNKNFQAHTRWGVKSSNRDTTIKGDKNLQEIRTVEGEKILIGDITIEGA